MLHCTSVHQATAQTQNLFVTEGSGDIIEITPDGTQHTFASGLNGPSGLAFDSAGNLFVAATGSGNIYKFTNSVATAKGIFASGLSYPGALVFDSTGNLFEADHNSISGDVYKFTPDGTKSLFATGLGYQSPFGLAINSAGNLFVGDLSGSAYSFGNITQITPDGTKSTFVASGIYSPEGLVFDGAGNLFVSDYNQSAVFEYTNGVATAKGVFASGLNIPVGLAFDSAGNLYEADLGSGTIYIFTNGVMTAKGVFATGLSSPEFITFSPNTIFSVNIKMFAGIIINNGQIGSNYLIQATANLSTSNWTTLTNVTLPSQPYIYIDYSSPTNNQRFYRAVQQ
jgi:sugar lactone lactonase YvrE